MMNDDLISRAALLAAYDAAHKGPPGEARKLIEEAPTVDAAPIVHGRWIDQKDEHQCSACKEFTVVDTYAWMQLQYDFCPYCGARMDGGDDK